MRLVLLALAAVLLALFFVLSYFQGSGVGGPDVVTSLEVTTSFVSETTAEVTSSAAQVTTTAPNIRPMQPSESSTEPRTSVEPTTSGAVQTSNSPATTETPTETGSDSPGGGMDFRNIAYYQEENAERYHMYASSHPDLSPQRVVIEVEMKLDRPFYSDITVIAAPSALDVLCNKAYALPEDYVPELVDMPPGYYVEDGKSYALRQDALAAFIAMADAARNEGYSLKAISAYRSRNYQANLYQRYSDGYGREAADTYSARPRHSEHETGLAVDINSVETTFENTREFQWLQSNAHKFGFILRYPGDSQDITGYIYEPWHYRYLGSELATKVRDSRLTYDEFYLRRDEF